MGQNSGSRVKGGGGSPLWFLELALRLIVGIVLLVANL